MARILSQTLIRESQSIIRDPFLASPSSRLIKFRGRSKRPEKAAQLLEVDLDADASGFGSGSGSGSEVEVLGMRRLEDALHGIIVRRFTPDWLPFIPGSSYWVPPRKRPLEVFELVGKLGNPMTEEASLSFSSARGWPALGYFVEGALPGPVNKNLGKAESQSAESQSDDEES